jgi:lantibiotic modifying enzyme
MTRSWRPLLDGELRHRAADAVAAIALALEDPPPASDRDDVGDAQREVDEVSLARGRAGYALFFGFKSLVEAEGTSESSSWERLSVAIDAVAQVQMGPSLFMGFTGVAWATDVLDETLFHTGSDANEAVDGVVLDVLTAGAVADYDLISGVVGLGVYALQRVPRRDAVAAIESAVGLLEERARHDDDGIAWFTPPTALPAGSRDIYRDGYFNLGVAHGLAGVVAFLAGVVSALPATPKAVDLLEGSVAWLLAREQKDADASLFPAVVTPSGKSERSRTAWCYGDAGTAAALALAGAALQSAALRKEALRIALAVARRAPEACGVRDACLCHGAAGLGHVLNRLAQELGDEELADAARAWFGRTLAMRVPGTGVGGFRSYRTGQDVAARWLDHPGMLAGAAGVALALLAAMGDVPPAWDRAFLLSHAARPAAR